MVEARDDFGDYRARTDIRFMYYEEVMEAGADRKGKRKGLLAALQELRSLLDAVDWSDIRRRDKFLTATEKRTERLREIVDDARGAVSSRVEKALDEILIYLNDVVEDPPEEPGYGKDESDVLYPRYEPVEELLDAVIDVLADHSD